MRLPYSLAIIAFNGCPFADLRFSKVEAAEDARDRYVDLLDRYMATKREGNYAKGVVVLEDDRGHSIAIPLHARAFAEVRDLRKLEKDALESGLRHAGMVEKHPELTLTSYRGR